MGMFNALSFSYASVCWFIKVLLIPKTKASRMKRTLLFVRDAFFITLFKTLFSIYKIHELFTSRGSVESACKV